MFKGAHTGLCPVSSEYSSCLQTLFLTNPMNFHPVVVSGTDNPVSLVELIVIVISGRAHHHELG
jgi:hypothetical protein